MDVNKHIKTSSAFYACLLLVVIPAFGWAFHYDFSNLTVIQILFIGVAKIGAFGGLAAFGLSLLIGNKISLLDKLFGGLDKMYYAHRLFGALSLLLLLLHPFGLYLLRLSQGQDSAWQLWFGAGNSAVTLGAVVLYAMLAIILFSIYTKVRHEVFIVVHRFLGVLFVLGSLHAFLTGSVIGEAAWLHYYLLTLTILASAAFIVFTVVNDIVQKPYTYKIESVKKLPHSITELVLHPRSRIMEFIPGQFAYIRLNKHELTEYHPFTIASGSRDGKLRFVIRKSGDFTKAISKAKPGDSTNIKGPFGRFTFFDRKHKKQLWIAGGIGVTPFLSKARSLRHNLAVGTIEMIYATGDKQPYGLKELEAIEHKNKGFNVTLFHEDQFGYVKLQTLIEHYKDVHERAIFVCGPPPLLNAVKREAEALHMSHQLHYEEFDY